MAECTPEKFDQVAPNSGKKMIWAKVTSAANGDIVTVSDLTVVEGVIGFSTTGVPLTFTITGTTNVITLANGGALVWNLLIMGR